MLDEVNDHLTRGHWEFVRKEDVPAGTKILPMIWSIKRKRKILTGEPYKWKARLTVHGGKQEYGVQYWETYSLVVTWASLRLLLILATLNDWVAKQIDFVLAFSQADAENELYLSIPQVLNSKVPPLAIATLSKW